MDITRELVRSVFPKSRSIRTHETSVRSNSERRNWKTSVRSYLCGDEFNSVLTEEDSASDPASSVGSSEATIKQPVPLGLIDAVDAESRQTNGGIQGKQNSTSRLHNKDDAATIIQSAIRSFLARRQIEGLKLRDVIDNFVVGAGSRRSGYTGTSIEFQTGITTGVDSFRDKMGIMPQPLQVKGRHQGLKLKEDCEDIRAFNTSMNGSANAVLQSHFPIQNKLLLAYVNKIPA
ncbi:hypothetical protein POM88_017277 [Heracleum sosnowskyi]|uniref:Uncharacterized protein n=1 Tax=Heracleum sosnowskyi TaxID=360622 RepID=A0AAD8IQ67_9APIA|nr:hypothetical protein POM88_017277 [Heracleum sosnowskyi]